MTLAILRRTVTGAKATVRSKRVILRTVGRTRSTAHVLERIAVAKPLGLKLMLPCADALIRSSILDAGKVSSRN